MTEIYRPNPYSSIMHSKHQLTMKPGAIQYCGVTLRHAYICPEGLAGWQVCCGDSALYNLETVCDSF